ncbi:hypothetical protein ABPG74_004144 [Tetrahymena malaccensis]
MGISHLKNRVSRVRLFQIQYHVFMKNLNYLLQIFFLSYSQQLRFIQILSFSKKIQNLIINFRFCQVQKILHQSIIHSFQIFFITQIIIIIIIIIRYLKIFYHFQQNPQLNKLLLHSYIIIFEKKNIKRKEILYSLFSKINQYLILKFVCKKKAYLIIYIQFFLSKINQYQQDSKVKV